MRAPQTYSIVMWSPPLSPSSVAPVLAAGGSSSSPGGGCRTRGAAGVGAAAFKRLCALLDEGNEEFRQRDAAEGVKRPPTIDSYVAAVNAGKGIRRGLDRH